MEIRITRAKKEDLPRLIDLAVRMIPYSISSLRPAEVEQVKEYRRRDLLYLYELIKKPNYGIFMAQDEAGNLLGHIIVGAQQIESATGQEQGWVFDLSVEEEYWGKGVAAKLQQEAENFVRAFGHKFLGLGVTSDNIRALKFYQKMGYREERKKMLKKIAGD